MNGMWYGYFTRPFGWYWTAMREGQQRIVPGYAGRWMICSVDRVFLHWMRTDHVLSSWGTYTPEKYRETILLEFLFLVTMSAGARRTTSRKTRKTGRFSDGALVFFQPAKHHHECSFYPSPQVFRHIHDVQVVSAVHVRKWLGRWSHLPTRGYAGWPQFWWEPPLLWSLVDVD